MSCYMEVPEVFRFPFEPYPIQLEFMKSLYQCIEEGKLGIFESPTGTGKSLSLICGTLTWLADHDHHKKSELEQKLMILKKAVKVEESVSKPPATGLGEPSWFTLATKAVRNSHEQNAIISELGKIQQQEERIQKLKQRARNISSNGLNLLAPEPQILPASATKYQTSELINLADGDILIEDDSEEDLPTEEPCEETLDDTKIIFASRTHSQISQFIREVKKSPFGDSIRLIPLASRQQLCINEEVASLKSSDLVNEKCLEMQKKKSRSTSKTDDGRPIKRAKGCSCPFRDTKRIQLLRDLSVTEIADIETLVLSGKRQKACPYYAARDALSDAQLIVVPYATLLNKNTREACGLKLRNNIVIIDEAHNLLETISSLHTICVWGHQISQVHWQLTQYHQRFNSRLSAKNLLPIKQLLFFLSCLMKSLGLQTKPEPNRHVAPEDKTEGDEKIYECSKFCVEAGFDHINIHSLVEFCEKTKLPQKLLNFKPFTAEVTPIGGFKTFIGKLHSDLAQKETAPVEAADSKGSCLMPILQFMRCLRNSDQDGRVICAKKVLSSAGYLKYVLLNPGSLFKDFVNEPRAVIVAGGTMQPSSEFRSQLFGAAGSPQSRIATFSCDHIIPPDHVLPLVLTRGPSSKKLDFSWTNRSNLLDELTNLLLNINQVVSGGVVCFLPSYDFESQVVEHWKKNNHISRFENRKKLFREPKEAKEVEHVLAAYARSIRTFTNPSSTCGKNGAMLLCVVGGKLSEGINFSDDLARCVVVVGLPYANSQSVVLKEKINYLNNNMISLLPEGEVRTPGQIYYESLCFKAVNQSIGRAIRHSKDYAVLVLADYRYSRSNSQTSLPGWIARQLQVSTSFGPSLAFMRKFLNARKRAEADADSSCIQKNALSGNKF